MLGHRVLRPLFEQGKQSYERARVDPMYMVSNLRMDKLFDCLTHHHRRTIVEILLRSQSPMAPVEVARKVAMESQELDGTEEAVESIVTSLYHLHLPKLTEAGLVEYDDEATEITPTPITVRARILLDVADLIATASHQPETASGDVDDSTVMS